MINHHLLKDKAVNVGDLAKISKEIVEKGIIFVGNDGTNVS